MTRACTRHRLTTSPRHGGARAAVLVGLFGMLAGCDLAGEAHAQRADVVVTAAPTHAEIPRAEADRAMPTAIVAGPGLAGTSAGSVDDYPVYPPAPTAYPLDEAGRPIFGLDIGIEDQAGTALRAFHAALRRAERAEGQARIVVYGASHVASDTWTGPARRALQTRFGDAGHGFILPVEPWRTYHHQDIALDGTPRLWRTLRFHSGQAAPERFGLAGVAVETDNVRAFARVDTGERTASRLEVFFERQPGGGSFDLLLDGQRVRRVATGSTIPAAGYDTVQTVDSRHALEIRPHGDGPVRIYGVALEREAPGVVLDTLGINGARAASQLYWDEALFQEHLRRRMPDLVVLAYGTNESGDDEQPIERYEEDLRQVIQRVQRTVPLASCLLVGPSDRPVVQRDGTALPRQRTYEVIRVQRRLAREYGCGFFDLVAFGGGPMHMLEWAAAEPAWASRDHIHFTPRAYTRLGQVIANALLRGY